MKLNELFVVVYKSNPTWLISDTVFVSREEAAQPVWHIDGLPEREVITLAEYIAHAYRTGYADGYPAAL
jgi:hypothetical protein